MASRAERRQFWAGHVARFAASGLTRRLYCDRHDLSPFSLDYWRRRLRDEPVPAFVPVQPRALMAPAVASSAALQLRIGAAELTLPLAVDAAWLAALLRGLR